MENIERRVRREVRAMTRREVITKAITRQLTWAQAAVVLGITERHMRRIRRVVEHYGMEAVLQRRGGRTTQRRRIKAATIELLVRLKRDVYPDFSVRHFYEQVSEKHQVKVSYNWLRLMLQEAGVVEKEPARGTYRRRRERRPMVGMLVHLDASTHPWIAGLPMQDLVVALDDADGRILYGRFFAQEGTASTFAALQGVLGRYGRFLELYTDRGSHFCRTEQAGQGPAEEQNGQVAQALRALGIRQILARSPQARAQRTRVRHHSGPAAAGAESTSNHRLCRRQSLSGGGLHPQLQPPLHGHAGTEGKRVRKAGWDRAGAGAVGPPPTGGAQRQHRGVPESDSAVAAEQGARTFRALPGHCPSVLRRHLGNQLSGPLAGAVYQRRGTALSHHPRPQQGTRRRCAGAAPANRCRPSACNAPVGAIPDLTFFRARPKSE